MTASDLRTGHSFVCHPTARAVYVVRATYPLTTGNLVIDAGRRRFMFAPDREVFPIEYKHV